MSKFVSGKIFFPDFYLREMDIQENIVNKVALSALVTFDLAMLYSEGERILYDIKDNLFQELILKEKDFRAFVKDHDWSVYTNKHVAITCSTDAIVPTWAYMLLTTKLAPFAKSVVFGDLDDLEVALYDRAIAMYNFDSLTDQRIVVKGCGEIEIPVSSFVTLTKILSSIAKSIMYGEPCSTVPVYKRKD